MKFWDRLDKTYNLKNCLQPKKKPINYVFINIQHKIIDQITIFYISNLVVKSLNTHETHYYSIKIEYDINKLCPNSQFNEAHIIQ